MLRRSKAAEERELAHLVSNFVKDGVIDHEAVSKAAQEQADKLWSGPTLIYKTKESMVDGFCKDMIGKINSSK